MAKKPLPTPDELRQLLTYNPSTGELTWKKRDGNTSKSFNSIFAGRAALNHPDRNGHLRGGVWARTLFAHRVAWAIHYGEWPTGHINGNPRDNRVDNLRDVQRHENARNTKRTSKNTSGHMGVRQTQCGKWQAYISAKGKKFLNLGNYGTIEEAIEARRRGEIEHGYHPNHGRASN